MLEINFRRDGPFCSQVLVSRLPIEFDKKITRHVEYFALPRINNLKVGELTCSISEYALLCVARVCFFINMQLRVFSLPSELNYIETVVNSRGDNHCILVPCISEFFSSGYFWISNCIIYELHDNIHTYVLLTRIILCTRMYIVCGIFFECKYIDLYVRIESISGPTFVSIFNSRE